MDEVTTDGRDLGRPPTAAAEAPAPDPSGADLPDPGVSGSGAPDPPATAGDDPTARVRRTYTATDPEPPGQDGVVSPGDAPGETVGESPPTGDPPVGNSTAGGDVPTGTVQESGDRGADLVAARTAAEERLADLQRLQAEYVNYRRRVERDRDVAREVAVADLMESLLPVLDDVHLARQHGDLGNGPFAAIADKLESTLSRFGLARYGEPGEVFDPTVHEALMYTVAELAEGTTEQTVVQVLQPGYRVGERVLRAARVAVADPA